MVLLIIFQIFFGIAPGYKTITSDFPNYYVSAKLIVDKGDATCLYNNECFKQQIEKYGIKADGQFALYPPLNAFIFLPLTPFDSLTAKRIWLYLNCSLILVCAYFIKKISATDFISSLNIVLLSGFALANDLFLGQIYLFLTVILLAGYYALAKNRFATSACCWAVAASLKYISIIFLPALVLKKKWNFLLFFFLAVTLLHLCAFPLFKTEGYSRFLSNTLLPYFQGTLYEGKPFSIQYQSWDAFLNNLFVYHPIYNVSPVFNFSLGYVIFKSLVWLVIIALLVFFYYKRLRSSRFYEIIFSLSVTSLIILEPGSASYHNLFLLVPVILVFKLCETSETKSYAYHLLLLYAVIGFAPTLLNKIELFYGENIFLSFHRLWLEMIFFGYLVFIFLRTTKNNDRLNAIMK